MMWSSPGYREIFGRPKKARTGAVGGLVDQADMLLTSVGSAEHPTGFNYSELLKAGKISAQRLKRLVVGDIGGILIHRTGKDAAPDEVLQLNRMWTGLDYDRLKALVRRADSSATSHPKKAGVVVVTCGRNRDEILEAVVRRGLVNELILDVDAAATLTERLNA